MTDHFDRRGMAIDLPSWIKLSNHHEYRVVNFDKINDVTISTVWLGLNHQFDPSLPPLIFETMIFGGEHNDYQERYSTEEEAQTGHERARKLVTKE